MVTLGASRTWLMRLQVLSHTADSMLHYAKKAKEDLRLRAATTDVAFITDCMVEAHLVRQAAGVIRDYCKVVQGV